jgi:hypothetical protein
MRLSVIHDSQGNIQAIIASPPDAPPAHGEVKGGQLVTEVDDPELTADAGDDAVHSRLAELTRNYTIEVEAPSGKLARKSPE